MQRKLRNWLNAYMEYTKFSESPEHFHKWAGIATVAGALRRRVWLDMGYFEWTPNFYIFFVAPAGIAAKSTTMDIGFDLLREFPFIHFGPSSVTWQALLASMEEAKEEFQMPDGSFHPQSAIVIAASELGTFLDPKNREMIDVLTSLWDSKRGAWSKVTKTGSSEVIENPWVTLVGCTTPSWVAENFSDYFVGGGFASRSIFVYAEKKRRLIAYPKKHFDDKILQTKEMLLHDLEIIAHLCGEFRLTPDAYDWGETWYKKHHESEHTELRGEKFSGYLARKQTHIHKLAMILSVIERDDLIIETKHLMRADQEISVLEKDMPLVYGKMNREKEMVIAADVMLEIRNAKRVDKTKLYKKFSETITIDTFNKILNSLLNTGLVKLNGSTVFCAKEETH